MAPMGQQPEPARLALQTVFCFFFVRYGGLAPEPEEDGTGIQREKRRRTAGQQNPPQQDSPATQKVSPQHEDPFGMQKGAKLEEAGMQHCTVRSFQQVLPPHLPHASRERYSPSGLKHSQLMSLAPRSFALLGKTHASPAVTLWYRGAARGANMVALGVDAWVRKAKEEILDERVGDGTLHVVV